MFIPANENNVAITGNISSVEIRNGANGPFGHINIAVDDSYQKPSQNNQKPEWVERTYFITVVLNDGFFKKVPSPQKGDRISVEGKLIIEKWQDKNTNVERSATKVKVIRVKAHISKQERDHAKQLGWYGNAQPQQQGGYAPQQPQQQGGFAQQQPQQQPQQQGGFAQQQGGYAPQQPQQQGGFAPQQPQQQGGFAPHRN
jgi:single-strand DNA-binding protein